MSNTIKLSLIVFMCCSFLVSCKKIPYDQMDVKLTGERNGTFESIIRESLKIRTTLITTNETQIVLNVTGQLMELVPYVGKQLGPLIPALGKAFLLENDWKETLAKTIPDETKRAIAENNMRHMDDSMKTIMSKAEFLKLNSEIQHQVPIVHDISTKLNDIINNLANREAIFKEYPLYVVKGLLTLTSFLVTYNPIEQAIVPLLGNTSLLPCRFTETLIKYRSYTVTARLNQIQVVDSSQYHLPLEGAVIHINSLPFKRDGYNETNPGTVNCHTSPIQDTVQLKDPLNSNFLYTPFSVCQSSCVPDYLKFVRYHVEKAFEDAIENVNRTCIDSLRNRPRKPTGKTLGLFI